MSASKLSSKQIQAEAKKGKAITTGGSGPAVAPDDKPAGGGSTFKTIG